MPRILPLDRNAPPASVAPQFAAVKGKLGMVPNLVATLGQSPVALNAYLGLAETVGAGLLSAPDRERVALTVAEANACDYCLAAHSLIGKGAGLTPDEIDAARKGEAADPRGLALVRLARAIVADHGKLSDGDLHAARAGGLNDGEILEVLANVVLNILTNYANHIAETTIDFPAARPLSA